MSEPNESPSTAARTAIGFAGFARESANVDFTQQLKNDSGVVLKPCKRYTSGTYKAPDSTVIGM